MYIDENKLIPLYQFDSFKKFESQIIHFVSTRNHSWPFSTNNNFTIGLNGVMENEKVLSNRKELAEQLGISPALFVFASQVHGNRVAVVKDEDRGKGAFERSSYLCDVDAMVTNKVGICLVTQAADCVPILFYDPIKKVIGAAHAGWKGTVAKIPAVMIQTFIDEFDSNPANIIVGVGPSIGPCCYEVGEEVVEMVEDAFGTKEGLIHSNKKFAKPVFDLWETNYRTLIDVGIKHENIELANLCTKCNNNNFFSARAGDKGRFGAGIMLR